MPGILTGSIANLRSVVGSPSPFSKKMGRVTAASPPKVPAEGSRRRSPPKVPAGGRGQGEGGGAQRRGQPLPAPVLSGETVLAGSVLERHSCLRKIRKYFGLLVCNA